MSRPFTIEIAGKLADYDNLPSSCRQAKLVACDIPKVSLWRIHTCLMGEGKVVLKSRLEVCVCTKHLIELDVIHKKLRLIQSKLCP
jgi:hypothetical protein